MWVYDGGGGVRNFFKTSDWSELSECWSLIGWATPVLSVQTGKCPG